LYGRRWQIESYFKASKQYLAMDESQIQSYDGQVSYIAITELAYILLAWQERLNTDDRTLGDLFYSFTNSLPDITFICALVYLISVLKCSGNEFIEDKIDQFMHTIPSNVQNIISRVL
ncbi:IS4 family transposase, partial [Eggerthella lenta]|nr:IS4 family transposase [Eggerthella lenta]